MTNNNQSENPYEYLRGQLKFSIGRVVATKAVAEKMEADWRFKKFCEDSLIRHITGDWGDLDEDDKKENDASLDVNDPGRILSAYNLTSELLVPYYQPDTKIWIITEWDRSVTTILYPSDY